MMQRAAAGSMRAAATMRGSSAATARHFSSRCGSSSSHALSAALTAGARWRSSTPAAFNLASPMGVRHMSASAAGAAASSSAATAAAAPAATSAAATTADPASLLTQAADSLSSSSSSSPSQIADAALDVVVPQLTSLYGALDPDSSWHTVPRLAQVALEFVHNTTGLPWWASIALLTFGARLALSPLSVVQQKATTGLARAAPHLKQLREHHMEVAEQYGGTVPLKVKMEQAAETEAMTKKYGAKGAMLKTFGPALCSAPLFISFFVGLRAFAHVDPTFCTGGIGWFTNLAELDSYGILSVINGCMIAGTVYLNAEGTQSATSEMGRIMRKVMYGVAALSVPMTATMIPAGVLVYWITSSATLMIQAQLLRAKPVRKILGIPDMPTPVAANAPSITKHVEQLKIQWNQQKRKAAEQVAREHQASFGTPTAASSEPAQAPTEESVPINPFSRANMYRNMNAPGFESPEHKGKTPRQLLDEMPGPTSSASATYTAPMAPLAGKQKRKPQKSIAGNNNANTNRKR